MKIPKIFLSLIIVAAITLLSGCSNNISSTSASSDNTLSEITETDGNAVGRYLNGLNTFDVTSTDLTDGVWNDSISKTHIGDNASPQLSWTPIDGAKAYVIYMVDDNTNGFLHWRSNNVTETELPHGWASATEYAGPHIGHGYTHTFNIYVIAVKEPVETLSGAVNSVNPKLDEFIQSVDTGINGSSGNIIAYGVVSGTFTDARFRGDRTVDKNKPYYM